jgi:ClpP class serine protease
MTITPKTTKSYHFNMAIIYTNTSSGTLRKNLKKMNNLSDNQIAKFKEDHRLYNKDMKQKGLHDMMLSFDDYVKYRFGRLKTRTVHVVGTYEPDTVYRRETPSYPSAETKLGNGGTIDHKQRQERLEISKQYSIVPAYNKGPYMVVGKEDLKTAGRKV